MKFKVILALATTATLLGLTACQSMEEMRAERAKKGEVAERVTGSNLPRKSGVSDVKVVSGEAIRSLDAATGAAAAAAAGSGR